METRTWGLLASIPWWAMDGYCYSPTLLVSTMRNKFGKMSKSPSISLFPKIAGNYFFPVGERNKMVGYVNRVDGRSWLWMGGTGFINERGGSSTSIDLQPAAVAVIHAALGPRSSARLKGR